MHIYIYVNESVQDFHPFLNLLSSALSSRSLARTPV